MPDTDDLYKAMIATIAALKLLQAALEEATKQPLAVVAGQGRGSKKPKARLTSMSDG